MNLKNPPGHTGRTGGGTPAKCTKCQEPWWGGWMGPGNRRRPYEPCDQMAMQLSQHTLMTGGHGEEGREESQNVSQLSEYRGRCTGTPRGKGHVLSQKCLQDVHETPSRQGMSRSQAQLTQTRSLSYTPTRCWLGQRGKRTEAQDRARRGHGKPHPQAPIV